MPLYSLVRVNFLWEALPVRSVAKFLEMENVYTAGFKLTGVKSFDCDVLVVGGGVAGCYAAIKARERNLNVVLVDKFCSGHSYATRFATLNFLVYNPGEGVKALNCCMNAVRLKGEYLNDPEWTEIVLRESWNRYLELVSWGADFRESEDGSLFARDVPPFTTVRLGRQGVGPACRKQVEKVGVKTVDRVMITNLLKNDGKVVGALGFSLDTGESYVFKAKATVLATGLCSFYMRSSGNGDALAYEAGASITSREFVFVWPWHGPELDMSLATARCVYMKFLDGESRPVKHNPREEIIDLSLELLVHAGKAPIYWDLDSATSEDVARMEKRMLTHVGYKGFNPGQGGKIRMYGGHWMFLNGMGGVWLTGKDCSTEIPGLYAAGDCAGTRTVGAYHTVSGFGLASAAVTGARAGVGAAEYALKADEPDIDKEELTNLNEALYLPVKRSSGFDPRWVIQIINSLMTPYYVYAVKRKDRLKAALTFIEFIREEVVPKTCAKNWHELWLVYEIRNMVLNVEIFLNCSLFRTESRGMHFREDYPQRVDPDWLAWVMLKNDGCRMKLWKKPIPRKWQPDLSVPYEERYPRKFQQE